MKRKTLELLGCPTCHGELSLGGEGDGETIETGTLACAKCRRQYPIQGGIPHFVKTEELGELNRRFAKMYDRISPIYGGGAALMYTLVGHWQRKARRQLLDRLVPFEGRVIEISVGTGVNLRFLFEYPGQYEVFGLDISLGQLRQCQSLIRRRRWAVDLFLGNAEELPFPDNSFDRVFHVGGINFFGDKKKAIEEMIRIARPGAPIVIADETEKLAHGAYDPLPGFSREDQGKKIAANAPIDLVPPAMQGVRLDILWKGMFYCLDFRKPG
jgi:ubiquinone/menaquinone biosynthesis C-methylase UbiE